jgi:hypothetical protein
MRNNLKMFASKTRDIYTIDTKYNIAHKYHWLDFATSSGLMCSLSLSYVVFQKVA